MASEDFEDIRRVLAICFRNGQSMDALDIERIISFDMEWIGPDEAEAAVQALVAQGWLEGEEAALTPTISLKGVTSPLGWFPRPSRLLKPVSPLQEDIGNSGSLEHKATPLPKTSAPSISSLPAVDSSKNDPRAKLSQRLAKFISKATQIPLEEVERRALRKQQALGYATQWMGLALVAREQNLVMDDITAALSPR